MSEVTPTPTPTPTKTDILWRVIIITIFVIGAIVVIGVPLLNGNWRSGLVGVPVVAFGILIAAIRSVRR